MSLALIRTGFVALLIALALVCARRLDFGSDITNFMPDADATELALLARSMSQGDLARTMFLTIGTRSGERDDATVARAVRAMADRLRDHPEVAWLRIAPEDKDLEAVWKVLFPRRFGLVSLDPETDIPAMVTPEAIASRAEAVRQELASPAAAMTKRLVGADPLGFFPRIVERMREESPALDVRDGVFFSRDGYGVAILATRHSAFDSAHQVPLLADIASAFAAINERNGGALALETSGVNRFAVAAEHAITGDMLWIGGASFVSIAALFLAFFRSLPRFLVAMLPAIAGLVVPGAIGSFVFERLDGLTMAFGASLIGATIDYPTHLLNHFSMLGGRRRETAVRLAPSISMAALTTMASFAGLGMTSLPGFRQIAFFATVGVAAALATTLFVVPFFVPENSVPTRAAGAAARVLRRCVDWLVERRPLLVAVPIAIALLAAAAWPHARWEDDLSKLGNVDAALQAEDQRVRARVSPLEMGRAVMVAAADEQQTLVRTEDIARRLEALREAGAISGFRTAADFVWSFELQERNRSVLRAIPDLADRVTGGFVAAGFRAEAFAAFRSDLASLSTPPPPAAALSTTPLAISDLEGTGLDTMLQPMLLHLGDRYATVAYLREPRDEPAVRAAMHEIPGARYFVQRDFVNDLYAEFRNANLRQVLVGSILVIAVLFARYRRWRPTLATFLPSALVPVLVLSVLSFAGVSINLLHVVSLVMVMGMGTDYGVFLVDSRGDARQFEASLVSLLLCCLTTVATFAVLAISSHPALRSMGITTGLSVILSMVLAPVSLVIVEPLAVAASGSGSRGRGVQPPR